MRKGAQDIPGLREDIHPGVWQRHMLMWAPRKWTMAWGALCGAGFAKILFSLPFRLAPLLGFVWLLGQYGLVMLSRWDPQWDDVLLASWTRRKYKRRYESG